MSSNRARRRQVRRSESQWLELFAEQGRSGLSERAFCEAQGLGLSTYGKAKRRYRWQASSRTRRVDSEFVPVTSEQLTREHWDVEVSIGSGVVIRLRGV